MTSDNRLDCLYNHSPLSSVNQCDNHLKTNSHNLINLPEDSIQGLKKFGDDIKALQKKKGKQTKLNVGISKFNLIDVIKVCVAIGVIVATVKILMWMWQY